MIYQKEESSGEINKLIIVAGRQGYTIGCVLNKAHQKNIQNAKKHLKKLLAIAMP